MADLPPPPPPGHRSASEDHGAEPVLHRAPDTSLNDVERTLDPRIVVVWRVFGGLGAFVPVAALSIAGYFLLSGARWLVPVVAVLLWVATIIWYPRARYRAWRWKLSALALELRYGVVVHRHEAVPYFRVQQIDIAQGPIDRLLGLATLQVTTASASGSAGLPGIPAEEAPRVRHELLVRAAQAVTDQPDEVRDAV